MSLRLRCRFRSIPFLNDLFAYRWFHKGQYHYNYSMLRFEILDTKQKKKYLVILNCSLILSRVSQFA